MVNMLAIGRSPIGHIMLSELPVTYYDHSSYTRGGVVSSYHVAPTYYN